MKFDPTTFTGVQALWRVATDKTKWKEASDFWVRAKMLSFFQESLDMAKQQPQASVFTKFLTGMNKTWQKTKEQSKKGYADVPPGRYLSRLKSVKLYMYEVEEERPDGTKVKVKIPGALGQFTVLQGDFAGESMPWFPKFTDEEKVMYFQRDLRRLNVDVDNLDMTELDGELQRLTKEQPYVWIKRNKGSGGDAIFTNIDKLATQEEVDQVGGEVQIEGEEPGGEEPEPEPEPAPKKTATTGKGAAPTTKTKASGAVNPPQRPPKGGKVVTAAEEPEPEPEEEVPVGGEEPEPESADDPEPEPAEVELQPGDAVQFKLKGKPTRGTIKRWDDKKEAWVVRDDASGGNYFLKPDALTPVE